ncbi:serine hydrolase domain-containing protein [Caulifigura coniformis]|nr:serine hydrolase domain-containing protein [Caulifigura coniformis]
MVSLRTILMASCLATLLCGASVWAEDDRCAQVLQAEFAKSQAPGAMISWQIGGQPARTICLGTADVTSGRPVTPVDHFRIGSLSKMFVGTAALILVDEGKLSLDDPLSKFERGLPNGDRILLRHLGNHRSGLFNPIESSIVKVAYAGDPRKWWTIEELLAVPRVAPPYFAPDTGFRYSNSNTAAIAVALEKATGQPWDAVVREKIIGPLGLRHTSIPIDNSLPEPHARGYAMGTDKGPFFNRGNVQVDVTETSPSWWGPAGCMISNIQDLRTAVKPLATGALLKPQTREELQRWTPTDWEGHEAGFHLARYRGYALGHTGDVPGFQTCMFYLPKHDASVVVMTNVYGWSIRKSPADDLFVALIEDGLQLEQKKPAKD